MSPSPFLRRVVAAAASTLLTGAISAQTNPEFVELGPLEVPGMTQLDQFGWSIALDRSTIVVGAPRNVWGQWGIGEARVWSSSPAGWQPAATLTASVGQIKNAFGFAVAVDGDTLAVGANGDDVPGGAMGSVYVFVRSAGLWTQQAKLKASNPSPQADQFGSSVALDGSRLIVGAPGWSGRGSAYFFERTGTAWSEVARFESSHPGSGVNFGIAVAIDGERALVGQNYGNVACAYERVAGVWTFQQDLTPAASASVSPLGFGRSLDLDGTRALVGAPSSAVNGNPSAGAAYVFELQGSTWIQTAELIGSGVGAATLFGFVALEGDRLAVVQSQGGAYNHGVLYTFEQSGSAWIESHAFESGDLALDFDVDRAPSIAGPWLAFGSSWPARAMSLVSTEAQVGTPSCFGDGSGSACPCGNVSDFGNGRGCANSTGLGAWLFAVGSASVAADDLALIGASLPPQRNALLFSGQNPLGSGFGVATYDGLRCVGGGIVRHAILVSSDSGAIQWGGAWGASAVWNAGTTRRFQIYYRDQPGTVCGSGLNFSNSVAVTFVP